jgi:alanyl-tRNA synthetase
MQGQYPELGPRRDYILKVVELEENRFNQTLVTGLGVLDEVVTRVKGEDEQQIPGRTVFRLYDTFGFPKELTAEVAAEHGLGIEWSGFEQAMADQRKRGQEAHRFSLSKRPSIEVYQQLQPSKSEFVGYERLEVTTEIIGILIGGSAGRAACAGDEVEVVLRETPFYPESGGQVSDAGWLVSDSGRVEIVDTQRALPGLIVHRAKVADGTIEVGDIVSAQVDARRRSNIARHHTATHLLQSALREIVGTHAHQAGSLVAPDRLRFDYTHSVPLTREQLIAVQRRVNEIIMANEPVVPAEMSYREAIAAGAMALFGEKYGDQVRMVGVCDFSRELCGGTHVRQTGDIGLFVILSESGIGAGQRRIEALAGVPAHDYLIERDRVLQVLADRLQTNDVATRVDQLLDELLVQRRQLSGLQQAAVAGEVSALLGGAAVIEGIKVIAAEVTVPSVETMLQMGDALRAQLGQSVVVLGAAVDGQPRFVAMVVGVSAVHAGELVKEVAGRAGGSGGGRADVARGGGQAIDLIRPALATVVPFVRARVSNSGA